MVNFYKIPDDDPDLEAFERLIADFHPWYRKFKNKKEGRPSYKHKNFYYRAFEQGPFPGIDDPYCPFAFTFFNKDHLYNYFLQCHKFLEKRYGHREDKVGLEKIVESFENLMKDKSLVLTHDLECLVKTSCFIWSELIGNYIVDGRKYINADVQDRIVEHCQNVSDLLWELSQSEELEYGELKTLDLHGRYALLAKALLQGYMRMLPSQIKEHTIFWKKEIARTSTKKSPFKNMKVIVKAGFKEIFPRYIDVVLAHHIVKKLGGTPDMPSSPMDFIYKEIHQNNSANSGDLRAQYRWLFIKAWLYSYLKKYDLKASEVARQISHDDDFFYMSDMPKLKDFNNESHKEEIQIARFRDLKNHLSYWKNNKSEQGYVYSKILKNSKDQI
ncbi:hypothetical protein HWV00_01790 [Moritella sp. 24]|uniref:hypothetical protein n=1 Tax=Moritella sp. 24 TaxID=2746230 RepID=UPI001BA5A664|nr:hypothetical protein [Moritella sp. 24]QUM75072.1 hypothetical protein HWV00_01790 [Moritella sp. 24]